MLPITTLRAATLTSARSSLRLVATRPASASASRARFASTIPTAPHSPTPRPPVEAETFDGKASPRPDIVGSGAQYAPEDIRGIPPTSKSPVTRSNPVQSFGSSGTAGSASSAGKAGNPHAFAGPSKPRLIYERPGERDLPKLKSRLPFVLALGLLGVGWGLFLLQATNSERLASSVLRQVTFGLRNSKEVAAVLGEHVRLAPNWWGFGEPWISGTVNLMQGRVDLSFRIVGSKGGATVYFTSIRPQQEGAWRIVRYKVIADDGEVVRLEQGIVEGKK